MKPTLIISLMTLIIVLCSCGAIPQLISTAEHIEDDTAIKIEISQEALQRQTNVKMSVELDNGQVQK